MKQCFAIHKHSHTVHVAACLDQPECRNDPSLLINIKYHVKRIQQHF